MDDTIDERTMIAVRDGAVDRLGELFERHGQRVFGYFVRVTGDPDTSWDLVHDVFLRVLKYRRTYREGGNFVGWLFQIARNVLNSHYRRAKPWVSLDSVSDRPAAATILPLAQVERSEETRLLHEVFAALPHDRRELLAMSHFERLPYSQIADVLQCSVGAVKVRVHRAIVELRTAFLDRVEKGKQP